MKYTKEFVIDTIEKTVTNKIEAAHDEFGHHYKFVDTGEIVDSVTTRNCTEKPHLIPWAIDLAIDYLLEDNKFEVLSKEIDKKESVIRKQAKLQYTDVRDNAGSLGTRAHNIIEEYEKSWILDGYPVQDIRVLIPEAEEDSRVWGAVRSAEAGFKKYKVIPVAAEILVGIPKYGAGTLDLLVLNPDGELELWDHKTSNMVNDFYANQTAAYKAMFEHMTGLQIARIRILKLDKYSDKFKMYDVPDPDSAWESFKAISHYYDWMNNRQSKLLEDKFIINL